MIAGIEETLRCEVLSDDGLDFFPRKKFIWADIDSGSGTAVIQVRWNSLLANALEERGADRTRFPEACHL